MYDFGSLTDRVKREIKLQGEINSIAISRAANNVGEYVTLYQAYKVMMRDHPGNYNDKNLTGSFIKRFKSHAIKLKYHDMPLPIYNTKNKVQRLNILSRARQWWYGQT